jgi:hypothetical protein
MAHKHQASVVETQRGASLVLAVTPGIYHPKRGGKPVQRAFVASGWAPDDKNIDFVFGRLVDQTNGQIFRGRTLPFPEPHRWAIYFSSKDLGLDASHTFTLDVFGIVADAMGSGTAAAVWRPDSVTITFAPPYGGAPAISWPHAPDDCPLCTSNFGPYGTYDTAGTITATLKLQNGGGTVATASSIYYDPTGGIWAAQFNQFNPPSGNCELDVTETAPNGTTSSQSSSNLTFNNC